MIYKSKQKQVKALFFNGQNGEEVASQLQGLTWVGGTSNQLICHRNESNFPVQNNVMIVETEIGLSFMTLENFEKEYEAE